MNLSEIQKIVFIEYKQNGYLNMWNLHGFNEQDIKIRDIAELGLITTEVSEAIESVRSHWKDDIDISNLQNECADVIIRTLNFMSRKGFNAEKIILYKNKINLNRGLLHGKSV